MDHPGDGPFENGLRTDGIRGHMPGERARLLRSGNGGGQDQVTGFLSFFLFSVGTSPQEEANNVIR